VLEASLYMRNQLLRDTDWASMAHGVEVRVPLVDVALLKVLAPLLIRSKVRGKKILADSLKNPLPSPIVSRGKTGFMTPIAEWQKSSELAARSNRPARKEPWARTWATLVAAA
jgi:asparagine synthase (glutamine-hydrolysing)